MNRVVIPVTVLLLMLTGCGSPEPGASGLPTLGADTPTSTAPPTPTPTATPTPTPAPSPWTALPTVDVGPNKGVHTGAVLGSSVARTPQEKAAVDTLVAYWDFVTQSQYDVAIDKAEIVKVASGAPVTNLQRYVARLRATGAQTIGWVSLHVTAVTIFEGGDGLLTACVTNGSFDVDRKTGRRLEKAVPGYDSEAGVRTVDGYLVVTSARARNRTTPCPPAR